MNKGILTDGVFGVFDGDDLYSHLSVLTEGAFCAFTKVVITEKLGGGKQRQVTVPIRKLDWQRKEKTIDILLHVRDGGVIIVTDLEPDNILISDTSPETLFINIEEKPRVKETVVTKKHTPSLKKLLRLSFEGRVQYLANLGLDVKQIAFFLESTGLETYSNLPYEVGRVLYLLNNRVG